MLSRVIREKARRDAVRVQERGRGLAVAALRFSSSRSVEVQIPQTSKLPISDDVEEIPLQDETTGELFFLENYSDPDGPDVVGP